MWVAIIIYYNHLVPVYTGRYKIYITDTTLPGSTL